MDEMGRLYLEAANEGLKKWKRRAENAERTATRRLGLLRRLSGSGMLHDITCELLEDVDDEDYCEDCALLRDLAEELNDED